MNCLCSIPVSSSAAYGASRLRFHSAHKWALGVAEFETMHVRALKTPSVVVGFRCHDQVLTCIPVCCSVSNIQKRII